MTDLPNYMYIGPTVSRIGLKGNTIIEGAIPPPQLQSIIDLKPVVKVLFIPTNMVSRARKQMRLKGTIEFVAAQEVISYGKEKIEKERIVQSDVGKEL